jgi:hypothetical protein
MIQVANSSTVVAHDYDKTRDAMIVEYFKTGKYIYYGITEDEYKIMCLNTSPGKAIKDLIKGKEFKKI